MNKAIFFDRDGCLIVDKHYLSDPKDVEFFPETIEALNLLKHDFQFFIVTNQSGIGRGYFSEEQMHLVHEHLVAMLKLEGIQILEIAFCPHAPSDGCDCRKPSPQLPNKLCQKYQINKALSYFIGDKEIDAECGNAADLKGCVVHLESENHRSFNNLLDFAHAILAEKF